jgi:hypothetical protein
VWNVRPRRREAHPEVNGSWMAIGVEIWTELSTDARERYYPSARPGASCRKPIAQQSSLPRVSKDMWKVTGSVETEGESTVALESILYISAQATSSNSVLVALESTG